VGLSRAASVVSPNGPLVGPSSVVVPDSETMGVLIAVALGAFDMTCAPFYAGQDKTYPIWLGAFQASWRRIFSLSVQGLINRRESLREGKMRRNNLRFTSRALLRAYL
jgi:hypothetical protein